MAIAQHLDTFAGLKVVDYEPAVHFRPGQPGTVAYRLGGLLRGGADYPFPALLGWYLAEPGAAATTGLVVGAWNYEDMLQWGAGNRDVVENLVAARDGLPRLRALFLGDITVEECEISWITQGDVNPLLSAYPRLEEFRVRGTIRLTFGRLRHGSLQTLAVESGGLPAGILEEIWAADLPQLEHVELWLGADDYGGITAAAALEPLLSGRLFPRLRYLGLRNSDIADAVARAVAAAPVLERVDVLDLSLGSLSDEGARALLASPAVGRLEKLDLHHHFVSPEVVAELQGLGIEVDAGDVQEPDTDTYNGVTEIHRYNAHSE
jgi:hypothetical protein